MPICDSPTAVFTRYLNHKSKEMETEDNSTNNSQEQPKKWGYTEDRSGRAAGGLVIVILGALWLAKSLGADIPQWIISWPMFLIGLGIFIGAKHSFRNPAWFILVIIGSVFLLNNFFVTISLGQVFWPLIIITAGLVMIFKPRNRNRQWGNWDKDRYQRYNRTENTSEDYLESVSIFGSVKKNIIAKDFKGGESVCVFGGSELNLTQADINGRVVVELVMVFGGTKLIVPANWQIQSSELVSIFGGLEDKRPIYANTTVDSNKVLILKGTCIFGGITIKSY